MQDKYTIGLDFGTGSARAVLVEVVSGKLAACAESTYKHGVMCVNLPDGTKLGEGWALQHPADYLEALESTVPDILKKARINKSQVIGLAIDFTSCTLLPVNAELTPLCMMPQYMDRPHSYVKLWNHHAAQWEADEINQTFGIHISSELMLPKILQLINEDYEIYRRADQILEAGDWLGQLLTGNKVRSASMASYKAMWSPESGYAFEMRLGELHPLLNGMVKAKLSGKVCFPGEKIGGLTSEWAEKLGLDEGIAVGSSIIDAHAGISGCGVVRPGQMMLVVGTSTVQAVLENASYQEKGIYGSVKNTVIPGYYTWESGIAAAGDVFKWFTSQCVPESYTRQAKREGEGIHKFLEKHAQILKPGESGVMALEWWNGNKTPYLDSNRSGILVGCTLQTRPEEFYRALLESVAYGSRMIMETFEEAGSKVEEVYVCGGIAKKNDLLMQICADVLNKELKVSVMEQIPALGAAMYAAVAAGEEAGGYASINMAVQHMGEKQKRVFRPRPENVRRYEKLYKIYKQLTEIFAPKENDVMRQLKESIS